MHQCSMRLPMKSNIGRNVSSRPRARGMPVAVVGPGPGTMTAKRTSRSCCERPAKPLPKPCKYRAHNPRWRSNRNCRSVTAMCLLGYSRDTTPTSSGLSSLTAGYQRPLPFHDRRMNCATTPRKTVVLAHRDRVFIRINAVSVSAEQSLRLSDYL